MLNVRAPRVPAQHGFSMIEIVIAIVVVAIGLLGLAKLQAVGISESATANLRALAAIESDNLIGAMHANTNYWQSGNVPTAAAPATFNYLGVVTDVNLGQALPANRCVVNTTMATGSTGACTSAMLAARDVQTFAAQFVQSFPAASGRISCVNTPATNAALGALPEVSCTVLLKWGEKSASINSSVAAAASGQQLTTQTYQFMVQP
jgi:type IV pilus assembly protein PilV